MNEENMIKMEVLKLAQKHQIDMLEQGIISSILYYEWGGSMNWEFEVEYLNVYHDGDTSLCFDKNSLQ